MFAFPSSRYSLLVCALIAAAALGPALPESRASVFLNNGRWNPGSSGWSIIPVCVEADSSAKEEADDPFGTIPHDILISAPNPSFDEVLLHVRRALAGSWERVSSVRFVGWGQCTSTTQAGIHLFIHPDAKNESGIGRNSTDGFPRSTHFQPWGASFNRCIKYDAGAAKIEYSFDCVEQYAIHEFGHALGFVHEFEKHPDAPQACREVRDDDGNLVWTGPQGTYSTVFDPSLLYTIVNTKYDMFSIMTYHDPACSAKDGNNNVRFGFSSLSASDIQGVSTVYPLARTFPNDIGVLAEAGSQSCGDTETLSIYMDEEDNNAQTTQQGWIGASRAGPNLEFVVCRADGRLFHPFKPPVPGSRLADYAVLQLGTACPDGSRAFTRRMDNEDTNNLNFMSGTTAPTMQNLDGGTFTEIHFCLFQPELSTQQMTHFPILPGNYGVFAKFDASFDLSGGTIFADDEDSNNTDNFTFSDASMQEAVNRIIFGDNNTTFFVDLVTQPDAIAPTSTVVATPAPNLEGWINRDVSVALSSTDNAGGTGVGQLTFFLTGAENTAAQTVEGDQASLTISAEGVTTLHYQATDRGGNVEAEQLINFRIDKTAPAISASITPPPNGNAWNNTPVVVTFACQDFGSGLAANSPPAPITLAHEGVGQTVSGGCTDQADNSVSTTVGGISIDLTAPTLMATASPAPNANGWNNSDVTVSFQASDALSGVASASAPITVTAEGKAQVITGHAADRAGNVASVSKAINIDRTPPEAFQQFDPATRGVALFGRDLLSGAVPGAIPLVASHSSGRNSGFLFETRTYKAVDLAGNALTVTERVEKLGPHFSVEIVGLQYAGKGVVAAPRNVQRYSWELSRDGKIKRLSQTIVVHSHGVEQEVEASFDARHNQTVITVKGAKRTRTIVNGLSLLRLVTNNGKLGIEF